MIVRESVPLSSLTTLKVGGVARAVIACETETDVRAALQYAKEHSLPWYVLGEGSNVLARSEGYDGVVLLMKINGISCVDEDTHLVMSFGAGVPWEHAVREAAARGVWGIENLAGIPGTCGATPVQNIGAYGADISQVLVHVDVLDAATGQIRRLSREECELGYRDSRFKREPHLIILAVAFRLAREGAAKAEYGDLQRAKLEGVDFSTPEAVGEVVRAIRSKKFPDLATTGTAGSFFKNPVVTPEVYADLVARYGEVPQFPNPHGIKIPLAFILDKVLGLRGHRMGHAYLFGAQPLVVALDAGGTSEEIEALARDVEQKVFDATHIRIEREVRSLENNFA